MFTLARRAMVGFCKNLSTCSHIHCQSTHRQSLVHSQGITCWKSLTFFGYSREFRQSFVDPRLQEGLTRLRMPFLQRSCEKNQPLSSRKQHVQKLCFHAQREKAPFSPYKNENLGNLFRAINSSGKLIGLLASPFPIGWPKFLISQGELAGAQKSLTLVLLFAPLAVKSSTRNKSCFPFWR